MFNVFEQFWTLVILAILVLLGMLIFRSVLIEKRQWWVWVVPLLIAGAGFGFDWLIQTDMEKVKNLEFASPNNG